MAFVRLCLQKNKKNRTPTRLSLLSYISFSQFIFQTFVRQSESFGKMGQIDKKIEAEYKDTSFLGKKNWLTMMVVARMISSNLMLAEWDHLGKEIKLIRLDFQWRGCLHSYKWMDGYHRS